MVVVALRLVVRLRRHLRRRRAVVGRGPRHRGARCRRVRLAFLGGERNEILFLMGVGKREFVLCLEMCGSIYVTNTYDINYQLANIFAIMAVVYILIA